MNKVTANDLLRARQRYLKLDLKATPATLKETGETVYLVLSESETKKLGYPAYHMVKKINGKWRCQCKHGCKDGCVCLHSACAYDTDLAALKVEKDAIEDAARETECAAFRLTYQEFFIDC